MNDDKLGEMLAEVSHYLKGYNKDALNRIPKKMWDFIEQNKNPRLYMYF